MDDQRLKNEILHGKHLLQHGAGEAWNWNSPAGKARMMRRVAMLSSHMKPDMQVLELGCGIGLFTQELVKTQAQITAIDISADLLAEAQKNVTATNVLFKVENAYDLSCANNTFDSIVGSSVLHHLDVDRALQECLRTLKPGGTLFFTEPNYLNPQIFCERKIPFLRKALHVSPDETAFVRWILKKQLLRHGFQNIRLQPFDFLHPATPQRLIPAIKGLGSILERTPVICEIAGSLSIYAQKPL
jgi:2-polyprenyl-3-methyl-5-hydroxy-6-metoxy-1,4-benzoquinol methylase